MELQKGVLFGRGTKTKEAIQIFEKFFIEGQDIDNYIIELIMSKQIR
ncbi:MAG: hypothetical protein CM15mV88_320 [Caudoviricetes sp.]|nr:MAG: hypothetical protein CM15mV88_320 [Caudoviricetes sp.]